MHQEGGVQMGMNGVPYSRLDQRKGDVLWVIWAQAVLNGLTFEAGELIEDVRVQARLPVCRSEHHDKHIDILVRDGLIAVACCKPFKGSRAKKSATQVMVFKPGKNQLGKLLILFHDTIGEWLTSGEMAEQCGNAIDIYLKNYGPKQPVLTHEPKKLPDPKPNDLKLEELLTKLASLVSAVDGLPENPSQNFPEPIDLSDKYAQLTFMALCLLAYKMQGNRLDPQNNNLGGLKTKLTQWAKEKGYPVGTIVRGWDVLRQANILDTPGYTGKRPKSFTLHFVHFLDRPVEIPDASDEAGDQETSDGYAEDDALAEAEVH